MDAENEKIFEKEGWCKKDKMSSMKFLRNNHENF